MHENSVNEEQPEHLNLWILQLQERETTETPSNYAKQRGLPTVNFGDCQNCEHILI